jgi:hypothetical protein
MNNTNKLENNLNKYLGQIYIPKGDNLEIKTPTFDFQYALELMKKKDMNQYSENELKMFNEIFKYTGYNIDFFKIKKN